MKTYPVVGGLAGKILRVNLTNGSMSTDETAEYAKRFIGGRAINSYILLNELSPRTKWSDLDNLLIFGAGCLEGTLVPSACRVSVDSKSVFNNGKGSANAGGHFGPELKYAGFDHVVIKGKAENPVFLWIHDGNAEIRDASSIWGKTTYETERILREELGDKRIEVASIGPAGENLVRGSAIVFDCAKIAGGSGVGCVMGDKRLKAVAVRGHGAIKVAQPGRFLNTVNIALEKINHSPLSQSWRQGIIGAIYLPDSKMWDSEVIVRNGQDQYWPMDKRARLVGRETGVPKYKKGMTACFGCPVGCMPFFKIDEGKYKNTRGIGYWINSAFYSQRLDVDDPAASLRFHLLANQLGLDGDATAVVLSWAFECYEKGLLTKEDTDGLELTWGNEDAMMRLEHKLAYREGIGDFLADGVKEAARNLGRGSEEFAIHMKGQDSVDPYRIEKGWALGCATSPVAGRHLRGAVGMPDLFGPKGLDFLPTGYKNQAEAVLWQAQTKEIEDIMGICALVGTWGALRAFEPADYAKFINAVVGTELTEEELMFIGKRSYNLEKGFNTIHTGFDRKDDLPPLRYMEDPVKSGPYKGEKIDKVKFNQMLDRFYELQGWDVATGLQTHQGLVALDLEDIADKIREVGRLIE